MPEVPLSARLYAASRYEVGTHIRNQIDAEILQETNITDIDEVATLLEVVTVFRLSKLQDRQYTEEDLLTVLEAAQTAFDAVGDLESAFLKLRRKERRGEDG